MKLTQISYYAQDDPEYMGDAVLVELRKGAAILLSGDWYHDKITDQIKGFINGLVHCGHEVTVTEEQQTSTEY